MMEFKKRVGDAGLKITSSHVNPPVREYTKLIVPRSPSIGRRRLMTIQTRREVLDPARATEYP